MKNNLGYASPSNIEHEVLLPKPMQFIRSRRYAVHTFFLLYLAFCSLFNCLSTYGIALLIYGISFFTLKMYGYELSHERQQPTKYTQQNK